jgi:methylglyoxal synthase
LALFAALWELVPALASWLLSQPLQWSPLHDQTVRHLLVGGAVHDSPFAFNVRTALAMLMLAIAGFVCSYRASASARPVAALDNGAC